MKSRLLVTLSLFVLVLVISVLLLLSEKREISGGPYILSNLDPADIRNIRVERADKAALVFEQQNGVWMLSTPLATRANPLRVASMIELAGKTSHARLESDNVPLEAYGLATPVLTLHLGNHRFYFGNTDPIDRRRYVLFDSRVHLLDDGLFHQLMQGPYFFASTKLVPETEQIVSIRFNGQQLENTAGGWTLTSGEKDIDSQTLENIVSSWGRVHARRVQAYQEHQVEQLVTLGFKSHRSARFEVLSTAGSVFFARPDLGISYRLSREYAAQLLLSVPEDEGG